MSNPKLKNGDAAPQFELLDQNEETVSLRDFEGQYLVLYFYPKDNTPSCTNEALAFTASAKEFHALNAEVVGVSKDSTNSHKSFIEKRDLSIRLLSDPDSVIQDAFGVWRDKTFRGKTYIGTIRSTFLIDPKGQVVSIWDNVKVKGHVDEVLSTLRNHVT